MYIAIDGTEIAIYPSSMTVTVMDLDDGETTTRTADGLLTRDRIAVKRQIELAFPHLEWATLSVLMQSMSDEFFEVTYPDPYTGQEETKTFYVGNRAAPVAFYRNDVMWWQGLTLTLTEQ